MLNSTGSGVAVLFIWSPFLLYCIYLCVRDIQATRRRKGLQFSEIPSGKYYVAAIRNTVTSAAIALVPAAMSGIPVLGSHRINSESLLLGLAFLILSLCLDPLEWKFAPAENKVRMACFLPRTARERFFWLLACMVVGVCEEIVYRAVLFGILFRVTGEYWIAAIASGVLFAFAHYYQGWLGLVSTFATAICLQWLVNISGGLYLAIGIHFTNNFINGIVRGMLTRPGGPTAEDGLSSRVQADIADGRTQG